MIKFSEIIFIKNEVSKTFLPSQEGRKKKPTRPSIRIEEAIKTLNQNVHSIGVGYKIVNGDLNRDLCIRFYVYEKFALGLIPRKFRLPTNIDGFPVDVIESGAFDFISKKPGCSLYRQRKQRPLRAGISASHEEVAFGTLGAFCNSLNPDDDPNDVYVLSNNHVFGDLNKARPNDHLYQPSLGDDKNENNRFAVFARGIRLQRDSNKTNRVDAAIGRLNAGIDCSPNICSIGRIAGLLRPRMNLNVQKHGRTSGRTFGKIADLSHDTTIRGFKFVDQIRIVMRQPSFVFAVPGDSGSIVLTDPGKNAVGLLFAAEPEGGGLANPIHDVVESLNIELL